VPAATTNPIDGTSSAADPIAAAALGYLNGRRSLLPAAERDLLGLWTRTARGSFSVVRAGRRQAVLDDGRRRRVASWEGAVPRHVRAGAVVDGWSLPTLATGRTLFVASSRPPDHREPGAPI
jgi:hypothetical protein